MKGYKNIIVTGSLSWDIIMDFPSRFVEYLQPEKLHQINVSFVVDKLEKQMGGTATNIAYAASQINGNHQSPIPHKVLILGAVGKDGADHLCFFKKNKIETRSIIQDKSLYSATGSVITDRTDNQIWGFYYGACARGKDADFKKYVRKDDLMIISANHPRAFLTAQQYAIKNKIDYLYDVGMAMSWIKKADLEKGVMHARWLIGNDYEISLIMKTLNTSIKYLNEVGVDVITTLGEKGVEYRSKLESHKVESYKVHEVMDPTGAGDAWRGGFMAGLVAGKNIEKCLNIGNVTASFAIERYGTVNYRITKTEFNKRMKAVGRG